MEKMEALKKELCEKEKEEFLKKKSKEKFEFLYDKLDELLWDEKECEHYCNADENSDWIEKIKFEQCVFLENQNDIESTLNDLDEKIEKIIKILKLEKKIEDYDEKNKCQQS